jgi:hypothetical protein
MSWLQLLLWSFLLLLSGLLHFYLCMASQAWGALPLTSCLDSEVSFAAKPSLTSYNLMILPRYVYPFPD